MKLVNGAEPPKRPDGSYEDVNEEIFNMCTECGEQLDLRQANDAFGTEWATCETCLEPVVCERCGHDLGVFDECEFCNE